MDKGAWQATAHGLQRVRYDLAAHTHTHTRHLKQCVSSAGTS